MNARDEMLARVRTALSDLPAATAAASVDGASPEALPPVSASDRHGLVVRFAERAAQYRATVRHTTPDALVTTLAAAFAAHGAQRIGVPDGLPSRWAPRGVEQIPGSALAPRELDTLDGVLTGCALAIAETGTFALDGSPRCGPRALTLVPDLHVCVVEAGQIVADLSAAVAVLGPERPLTLVSGPSATSDIELTRIEGVHGPRRLEIVLVGEQRRRQSRETPSASPPTPSSRLPRSR